VWWLLQSILYTCCRRADQCLKQHAHETSKSCLQLCDGATPEEQEKWRLQPANTFNYLNRSTCFTLARVDNAEEYRVCDFIPMMSPLFQHRGCGDV
jgi:hypothetical protein